VNGGHAWRQPSTGRVRWSGIYGKRIWWWFPWCLTRWWQPGISRGADEWCNPSLVIKAPLAGALVIYPHRRRRLMPCPVEWEAMDKQQRADYAPCGWLYGGELRPGKHHHIDTWPCMTAELWLAIAAPEP
jgi:hypothetical protein